MKAGIDFRDLAHLADVDDVAGLILVRHHQLLGADEGAVHPGQPHRLAAGQVNEVDDVLVDLATQHHFHHVHGFRVGDPHALDEFPFLADPFQQVLDLGTTAVHHHRVQAHQLEQHHVTGEGGLEFRVGHGVAAVLDHHGLVPEALDVGQGFGDDLGFVGGGEIGDGHGGLSWKSNPRILQTKRAAEAARHGLKGIIRWPASWPPSRFSWAAPVRAHPCRIWPWRRPRPHPGPG
jgi:hypothetical protein